MVTTRVGPDGRVLVPVALRRELGLEPGTALVAKVDDDRLILERPDALVARAKARFADVRRGRSPVDELIDERRRAAQDEARRR
jgi:AbrB family looped-hinge helix DNA binding protein